MTDYAYPPDALQLSDLPSEPLDFALSPFERAAMRTRGAVLPEDPFERAALRQRRAVLHGRDAPDRNTDPATLASFGASFIPGAGLADFLGFMPDFRGGMEPSFLENVRQGNHLAGGLQLAGVFVPGMGSLRRAARATAGARRLAQRERIFDETIRRPDGEVPQFDVKRNFPDKVPDDLARMLATEGLEDQMLKYIENGRKAGAHYWSNTEPIRQLFHRELGPQVGEQNFRRFIHFVAATSAGSDVGSNIRNASIYYGRELRGQGLPEIGEKLPSPYHHYNSRNHQMFVRRNLEDEAEQLKYPKLSSMLQNLFGNYNPGTMDRHALRLPAMLAKDPNFLKPAYRKLLDKKFTMDELVEMPGAWRNPTAAEIPVLEQFYARLGQKAGLPTAQAQNAAWVGGADKTGVFDNGLLSFIQHFEDRVGLTADKWKLPVDEVLRRFVRGQMDLVALDDQQNATA